MARPLLRLLSTKDNARDARNARNARGDSAPLGDEQPSPKSTTTPSVPPLDDARLLAAMQSGDEDAASELHDRLRPRVDKTIRALLGPGHSEHDDLAQHTFIQIVLSLERYRGECSLETWAATIAARSVFKFLRRRKTERRIFQSTDDTSVVEQSMPSSSMGNNTASLKKQVEARNLAARIRDHLEGIEPSKAEAFLLHDVCGFDAREVAGIAGISEAAAHARIARGRRELHAKLAADPELRDALIDLEVEP